MIYEIKIIFPIEQRAEKLKASASLLKTNYRPMIATATHCVFDYGKKEFYKKIMLRPWALSFLSKL